MDVCARDREFYSRTARRGCDSVDVTSVQLTNRYVISVTILCKGIFLNFDHIIFAACLTIYGHSVAQIHDEMQNLYN